MWKLDEYTLSDRLVIFLWMHRMDNQKLFLAEIKSKNVDSLFELRKPDMKASYVVKDIFIYVKFE